MHRHEQPTQRGCPNPSGERKTRRQHETEVDTEAGMLSGISRKRSIRSNPYWFTEFCNSQCLSHFAAPFIVVRAETSVAESCKKAFTDWRLPPTGKSSTTRMLKFRKTDDKSSTPHLMQVLPCRPRGTAGVKPQERDLTLESSCEEGEFQRV